MQEKENPGNTAFPAFSRFFRGMEAMGLEPMTSRV